MKTQYELEDANFEKICKQAITLVHPAVGEIINSILIKEFTTEYRDTVLSKYGIKNITEIKEKSLNFILYYIDSIIKDNKLSESELNNLATLKRIFKIKEGDFYNLRRSQIQVILNQQFNILYKDNKVDANESLLSLGLQELFDLSYDQYQELSLPEIKKAVNNGANTDDLDTIIRLK